MKIAKLAQLASILAPLFVGAGSGCDSSSSGDPIAGDENDDDTDADEDRPTHTPDPGRDDAPLGLATAVPAKPADPPLRTAGCGNGRIDGDEQCDDGDANGATRECTDQCVFNACDLDAAGNCSAGSFPHPDFDLYPCAEVPGDKQGCRRSFVATID